MSFFNESTTLLASPQIYSPVSFNLSQLAENFKINLKLPDYGLAARVVAAMGFANPFSGEPPDDFSADNSHRPSAGVAEHGRIFLCSHICG